MTLGVSLNTSPKDLNSHSESFLDKASLIYQGRVMHSRLGSVKNAFIYPYYYLAIDLDDLSRLSKQMWLFSYNRWNVYSIRDQDYLDRSSDSIKQKFLKYLEQHSISRPARVVFLTCPRIFGYVFNPVSFYYCYDEAGESYCHVAEVNNTFDERHLYILENPTKIKGESRYLRPKDFHVSPFYPVQGDYEFSFSELEAKIRIAIDVKDHGKKIFKSEVTANGIRMTQKELIRNLVKYPFTLSLTMPRILWQALILKFFKNAQVFRKPAPIAKNTILQRRYRIVERVAKELVGRCLKRITQGCLTVQEVSGETLKFGDVGAKPEDKHELIVKHGRFYSLTAMKGAVGAGESYIYGDWDSPRLTELLMFLFRARLTEQRVSFLIPLFQWVEKIRHHLHANSLFQSRRNIHAHYDLGNDFFKIFLDPTLTYSSGYFRDKGDTLEQAQYNKIDRIIEQAQVKPGQHVLEIGSGWGAMALRLAQKYGAKVTTVTLSENQAQYVGKLIEGAGLQDKIEVKLVDYRLLTGEYDHIISVEMIEAVGKEYLATYFDCCAKLLKPKGRFVFQAITMEDAFYEQYSKRADWIQKYIFPGAHLPSLSALRSISTEQNKFAWIDEFSIGQDYAQTIKAWDETFLNQKQKVHALGFDDDFIRMWHYYFCYCEAGFRLGHIDDYQVTLEKNA